MYIIYKTTCLVNGKIYIGQHEVKGKKKLDIWYIGSGTLLRRAINKYGCENFKREVICKVYNQKMANELEEFFIKKYNSTDVNIGYNILSGSPYEHNPLKVPEIAKKVADARRGRVLSDEMKSRISKSVSKIMTKERRQMISKQHKGKVMSVESRKKISKANIGANNPMWGKRGKNSPLFGCSWISNGVNCRFIDISNGLPQGYHLGRK